MLGEDQNNNNITNNLNAKITNENAKVAKYVGRELFRSRQPAGQQQENQHTQVKHKKNTPVKHTRKTPVKHK